MVRYVCTPPCWSAHRKTQLRFFETVSPNCGDAFRDDRIGGEVFALLANGLVVDRSAMRNETSFGSRKLNTGNFHQPSKRVPQQARTPKAPRPPKHRARPAEATPAPAEAEKPAGCATEDTVAPESRPQRRQQAPERWQGQKLEWGQSSTRGLRYTLFFLKKVHLF